MLKIVCTHPSPPPPSYVKSRMAKSKSSQKKKTYRVMLHCVCHNLEFLNVLPRVITNNLYNQMRYYTNKIIFYKLRCLKDNLVKKI